MKCGIGLHSLLSSLTELGRDVMKHMLIYDPDHRSNIRRLLDHRYFADLRFVVFFFVKMKGDVFL